MSTSCLFAGGSGSLVVAVRWWLGFAGGWGSLVVGVRWWRGVAGGWGSLVVGVRWWLGFAGSCGSLVARVRSLLGFAADQAAVLSWRQRQAAIAPRPTVQAASAATCDIPSGRPAAAFQPSCARW